MKNFVAVNGPQLAVVFASIVAVKACWDLASIVDPESDPVGSEILCRIWIRSRIRNKSCRIRIRAALTLNESETKLL